MFGFLKRKFLVPVEKHSDRIIDKMVSNNFIWKNLDNNGMQDHFWGYLRSEYGIKQKYNWRELKNYMVFRDKDHYMMFLLKL